MTTATLQERVKTGFDDPILNSVDTAKIEKIAKTLALRRMYIECAMELTKREYCFLGENGCPHQGKEEIMIKDKMVYACGRPYIN